MVEPDKTSNITDTPFSLPGLIKALQTAFSLIIGLGAIVTVTGFLTVKLYLSQFTDITGYNLNPTQYLAAGIIPWLVSIALVFPFIRNLWFRELDRVILERRKALQAFRMPEGLNPEERLGILTSNTLEELRRALNASEPELKDLMSDEHERVIQQARETLNVVVASKNNKAALDIFTGFIIVPIIVSILYGLIFYGITPRTWGGGKPADVILTFKNETEFTSLGINMDPRYRNRSVQMLLLAELTDGILVADTTNGRVLAIKNEFIASIIDNNKAQQVIEGTPAPTETYIPTATEANQIILPQAGNSVATTMSSATVTVTSNSTVMATGAPTDTPRRVTLPPPSSLTFTPNSTAMATEAPTITPRRVTLPPAASSTPTQ
jgi:hypothetical protein